MYTSREAARSMIERAKKVGIGVTNLKLQKLLYIAHGASLAAYDKTLVTEDFAAWRYGPVLESLYHDLKVFGSDIVQPDAPYIQRWGVVPSEDHQSIEVIDDVLENFGRRSGASLVDWSHEKNGPWYAVYEDDTKNLKIPNVAIQEYFRQHVVAQV